MIAMVIEVMCTREFLGVNGWLLLPWSSGTHASLVFQLIPSTEFDTNVFTLPRIALAQHAQGDHCGVMD
jgi:hypothetical protein